ncbi:MAG: HNH endonuclease [Dehalococcoidia bacterium]
MSGASARRYAHADIRSALEVETGGKCAYCESRIDHVDFPNIEHIVPKSRFPDLVCDWGNLTLACTKCNIAKRDYYDAACMLVNPYTDDVNGHISFYGPMVFAITPDRGATTITRVDLNRSGLLFKRTEVIQQVLRLRDQIQRAPAARRPLLEELRRLVSARSEHAAAARRCVIDHWAEIVPEIIDVDDEWPA